ncbi:MAG TPA: hypothetical protein VN420_00065 [Candidatus Fimivivens sp.]|nr:hypothetical protein [Candidatus Fimivivens sp.]
MITERTRLHITTPTPKDAGSRIFSILRTLSKNNVYRLPTNILLKMPGPEGSPIESFNFYQVAFLTNGRKNGNIVIAVLGRGEETTPGSDLSGFRLNGSALVVFFPVDGRTRNFSRYLETKTEKEASETGMSHLKISVRVPNQQLIGFLEKTASFKTPPLGLELDADTVTPIVSGYDHNTIALRKRMRQAEEGVTEHRLLISHIVDILAAAEKTTL